MSTTRTCLCVCFAFGIGTVLVGCGSSGGSGSSTTTMTMNTSTTTSTSTTSTTVGTPIVPWSAKCSDHDACSGQGDCCPSPEGLFRSCCGKINSNVSFDKFVGVGYTTVPSKEKMNPKCDDFMAEWSEPIWGKSTRDDLQTIKDMGFDAVRTYGIGAHLNHTSFLDRASELGLKVLPGFADYPYLNLGSSCSSQKVDHLATDCIRKNGHDCHDVIKANYMEMLKNGYTFIDEDGSRRYRPVIHVITLINECELKLFYQNGEQIGQDGNHARVIISAVDGLLSAEDQLGIVGPRPALTATASLATCPLCKSVQAKFPGLTPDIPTLPFIADMFLGFQDPLGFLHYTPKHNLMQMYQTRWVNSFNTPRPAVALCETEHKHMKIYKEGPLSKVPVYIGEFHSFHQDPNDFQSDVEKVTNMVHDRDGDICGNGPNNLAGVNLFEFQVSYWKGDAAEGGTGTKYGMWGLGETSLGKTHADDRSIGDKEYDVWCLIPVSSEGHIAQPGHANLPQAVIDTLGGQWPGQSICSVNGPSTTTATTVDTTTGASTSTIIATISAPLSTIESLVV